MRCGRRLGLPLLGLILFGVSFGDPAGWRRLVLGVTLLSILLLIRREGRHAWLKTSADVGGMVLSSVVIQLVFVIASGGLVSPFLPFVVLNAFSAGLCLSPRSARGVVIGQSVVLLLLLGAHWLRLPGLLPRVLWGEAQVPSLVFAASLGVVVLAMALAMGLGGNVRQGLFAYLREVQRAHEEIRRAHKEHGEEMRELMAEIAHELKNPLTTIKGTAALMARDPVDRRNPERLAMLRGETERMQGLLEQFVTHARPLSLLRPEPVDLAELCREVLVLHEAVAAERHVALVLSGAPLTVCCDGRKIRQILINVIQNGLTVSPRAATLRLAIEQRENAACIALADEGPGLDPRLAGRLFTPGASTRPDGAGLGLCLSRGLARQHGGELTLTTRPGGGCLAELTLPLAGPSSPQLGAAEAGP